MRPTIPRYCRELLWSSLVLVLLGITETCRSAAPVIPAPVQSSVRSRVDYAYTPGIAVGVVNADGRAYFNYGQVSYESGVAPDENTLYEIGSVTKLFTATLLAEMVARREVALGDAVESLLPEGVDVPERDGFQITLQHLATHASGLPANPPGLEFANPLNPFADYSAADLHSFLGSYVLPRRPGATFEYSNLGMGILAHALAVQMRVPYEEALRTRILQPLGLGDTAIVLSSEQVSRRATGHHGVVPRPAFEMDVLAGAGALHSTLNELLTFLEHQLGIQSSPLSSILLETQRVHFAGPPEFDVGLGWFVISNGSIDLIFHNGATMGQTAFVGLNRRTDTGVVVLSNARVNQYSNVQDIGLNLLEPSLPMNAIARPADVPLGTLRSYFGKYEAADGTWFHIGLLHDHLTCAYSGGRGAVFTLYSQTTRRFLLQEIGVNANATFNVNATGDAVSLVWSQSGQTTTYLKQITPPRLTLHRDLGEAQVTLQGDTGIEYVIEASDDFVLWSPISTNTIWDGLIRDSMNPTTGRRFYRARSLE